MLPVLLAIATISIVGTGMAGSHWGLLTVTPAQAAQPTTETFTVMITAQGYDNGTLDLAVVQGDTIKITFVLDAQQASDTSPSNHHIIEVSQYNAQTAEIDSSHPNATLTFVATQTGTFGIFCLSPDCPIHYQMLSGSVTVKAPTPATTTTSSTTGSSSSSVTSQTTPATTQTTSGGGPQTSSTAQGTATTHTSAAAESPSSGPQLLSTFGWVAIVAAAVLLATVLILNRQGASVSK